MWLVLSFSVVSGSGRPWKLHIFITMIFVWNTELHWGWWMTALPDSGEQSRRNVVNSNRFNLLMVWEEHFPLNKIINGLYGWLFTLRAQLDFYLVMTLVEGRVGTDNPWHRRWHFCSHGKEWERKFSWAYTHPWHSRRRHSPWSRVRSLASGVIKILWCNQQPTFLCIANYLPWSLFIYKDFTKRLVSPWQSLFLFYTLCCSSG